MPQSGPDLPCPGSTADDMLDEMFDRTFRNEILFVVGRILSRSWKTEESRASVSEFTLRILFQRIINFSRSGGGKNVNSGPPSLFSEPLAAPPSTL